MQTYAAAIHDISAVFDRIDDDAVNALVARIAEARRVVVFGAGRERLQVMGFAMRLFHMGREVSVTGDMTTPPVGRGDLFLAVCGPGYLSTADALMRQARAAGAEVAMITAQAEGACAALADSMLVLPAQTMADDRVGAPETRAVLPMGSVFEGALFVLFEVMVLKLMTQLGITTAQMRARHTNLE